MVKTKDELKTATDQELLDMVEEAKGHTKDDFKEFFGTDFTYGALSSQLKARGYSYEGKEKGWVKAEIPSGSPSPSPQLGDDLIVEIPSGKNTRLNLTMTEPIRTRYEAFLKDKSKAYLHTSVALQLYMDAYEERAKDGRRTLFLES